MSAKILLVEDNPENRYLFTFLLKRAGYTVRSASNGCEALAEAASMVPDLVIMDIQMPEMDGYEATARLREDPRFDAVPIVGLSAFATTGDHERARRSGFAAYLAKPIVPEDFLREIAAYLPVALRP
ncbi:MAG: response regulator [Opitutae bacterium]|nr:response regulator [Opitutae bacterium]